MRKLHLVVAAVEEWQEEKGDVSEKQVRSIHVAIPQSETPAWLMSII